MIYNPETHVTVSFERLEKLHGVLSSLFIDLHTFEETNWIKPTLDRHREAEELKEKMGERDYAVASDFYFAVRRDPSRDPDDDTFELYACYKIAYLNQGEFPWENPYGLHHVLPDGFPEIEDEDNGLIWIKGDMEAVRLSLLSSGFEERPEIIPARRLSHT